MGKEGLEGVVSVRDELFLEALVEGWADQEQGEGIKYCQCECNATDPMVSR